MNIQMIQSPLRWIGSKRKLVPQLAQYIPEDTKELCSPFCGGCSLELALAASGIKVHAGDNSELLIEFWVALKNDPEILANTVKRFFLPLPPSTFYWAKKEILKLQAGVFRASMFYAINRASFSGATLDGGMEPGHPALNAHIIDALTKVDLSNIDFVVADYQAHLDMYKDMFAYLDPPYMGVDISYGEDNVSGATFDHLALYNLLSKRDKWILSYDNHPTILQLYKDYRVVYPHLTYSTRSRNGTKSRDVIIISNDL